MASAEPPPRGRPARATTRPVTRLEEILNPRRLRHLREQWLRRRRDPRRRDPRDATRSTAPTTSPTSSRCACSPTPSACGKDGRENLLPYGDHTFNSFGPPNAPGRERPATHIAETSAWIAAQCAREALAEVGFGADIWAAADRGDITPEHGTADGALAPHRRCRHHRPRAQRRHPRVRRAARPVGPAAARARARPRRVRRGDQAGVAGADVLPHRDPRRRHRRRRHPRRPQGPAGPRLPPTATRAAGTTRTGSTCPATRPGTSASAWASTSASGSTSRASRRRRS